MRELLGKRLGWRFEDGDSFHPASNVEKMRAGHPLTDEDRWPWLNAIADEIARVCDKGEHVIIACSALKHTYRDVLLRGRDDVRFVFLKGTQELIADRLAHRKGHFMPPGLLTSQFNTLEPPEAGEHVITVSIDESVEAIVDGIVRQLKLAARPLATNPRSAMTKISLVVSDVDGTLLTKDKTLTDRARCAVQRLHKAGIGFTITSSRPAIGMRFLIEPLALWLPVGPFNGSSIVDPEMHPVEQHLIPASAAERSMQILREFGADIWLFTYDKWLIDNPTANTSPHEQHTIRSDPTIVTDFSPYLASACKIVGASADAAGWSAARKRCRRRSAARRPRSGRRPIISTSPRPASTRARSSGHGQAPRHLDRRGRHHRRHAERPRDVPRQRHLDRDGQRHRQREGAGHQRHRDQRAGRFCRERWR